MGDLAMKCSPESIGLAWTGVRLCLNAVQDDYDTFKLFAKACEDIIGIMISCRIYGKSCSDRNKPLEFYDLRDEVLKYIEQTYQNILEFSYQMWKYSNENLAARFAKSLLRSKKTIVQSLIDTLHENESQMNKYAAQESQQSIEYYQKQGIQQHESILTRLASLQSLVQEMAQERQKWEDEKQKQQEEQAKKESYKSGMEQARKNYNEQKKALTPPVALNEMLSAKKKGRNEGTCTWVLTLDAFENFKSAAGGNSTCLLGGGGAGKSFLMAAMIEDLQKIADHDKSILVGYFFITKGSEATTQPERILQSLLSQLYAAAYDSLELLDKCNSLVQKYNQKQKNSATGQKDVSQGVTIEKTFTEVAKLIDRRLFLFVDGLDECVDGEPKNLIRPLQDIICTLGVRASVFYSTRPIDGIKALLHDSTFIDVQQHASDDIIKLARSEIDRLPGLTLTERTLVCDEVTRKAGWSFNYVRLAMDFMRQPWRRPLSTHLQRLPEGIDNIYTQSIEQVDPVYKELLATCLTWTLLSARPLTVRETMDIYQQTYVSDGTDHTSTQSEGMEEIRHYKDQIYRASKAFLRIEENDTIVAVHASVREYFSKLQDADSSAISDQTNQNYCPCQRCIEATQQGRRICVAELLGHIQIATTILRHLLSPSFRRRFYNTMPNTDDSDGRDEAAGIESGSTLDDGSKSETDHEELPEVKNDAAAEHVNPEAEMSTEGDQTTSTLSSPSTDSSQDSFNIDSSSNASQEDSHENDEIDTVVTDVSGQSNQAVVSEPGHLTETEDDHSVADSDDEPDGNDDDVPGEARSWNYGLGMRYEIQNLLWHLAQLEKYPSAHKSGKEWEELQSLLLEFLNPELDAWQSWIKELHACSYVLEGMGLWHASWTLNSIHPLHVAAFAGLTSLVRLLLERDSVNDLVNVQTANGESALYGVVQYQSRNLTRCDELISMLLSFGANPNGSKDLNTEARRLSPFDLYLRGSDVQADQVMAFLNHGASVSDLDVQGWAAIHYFAEGVGDIAIAKLLIEAGASVNQRRTDGETAMHQIVRRTRFSGELVTFFIGHGAEVDAEDEASERPLRECAAAGHCEGLNILLDHKAEIDDENVNGCTALHIAAERGHTDVVDLLLKRGADPKRLNSDQASPFHLACMCGYDETALRLGHALIEGDGFALAETPARATGKTLLMKSVALNMGEVAALILEHLDAPKQMSLRSIKGRQALHFAALKGKPDTTKQLLDWGADCKSKDNKGMTPLQLCYWKSTERRNVDRESVMALLIAHDSQAATADIEFLHRMVINNSPHIVQTLLDAGADLLIEDSHGWNALELAERYGRKEIHDIILGHRRASKTRPTKFIIKSPKNYILSMDGLEIKKLRKAGRNGYYCARDFQAVVADHPIPASEERYYYEVSMEPREDPTIKNPIFTFGLCQRPPYSFIPSKWHPGWVTWSTRSWGYHGDDGRFFNSQCAGFSQDCWVKDTTWGWGDTVGCGVDAKKGQVFWTRNGQRLMEAAASDVCGQLYLIVCLEDHGKAKINLGNDLESHPFMWGPGNTLDFDSDVSPSSETTAEEAK